MFYNYDRCPNCSSRDSERTVYYCNNCGFRGCWDNRGNGCWPNLSRCPKCDSNNWSKSGYIKQG
jgi:hypothetical protein